jgi:hypothetical protein
VQAGITVKEYTLTGLATGTTYRFQVKSRTAFSLSDFSNFVDVLCAAAPAQPANPTFT